MDEAEVRQAGVEDAEAVARVHLRSWQAAYRHVFPTDQLDALPLEPRIRGWQRGLVEDAAGCFVAGEPVAGFVYARRCQTDPDVGEVEAIYLDPVIWGTGVGRALLKRAEEALRAQGFDEAILWVLEDNPQARRFYETAGWSVDGGRKTWTQMDVDAPVVRYRKRLD